ncbi:aminoglycoside phosphotransferase (APT) family kinase protein [Actinoalloteichus hoggarensis]|uniref:Phosphotransferase enzyme family protein n=1 Tax=Actinoalloteichus hoggarensis TaxID=1470176 RepID=A0A221W2H1_9PSEU|nr:aminoglycoside phosphotransferase family protein [Actinoalloteichus hoggarensis]ASO19889.1 Phosphotransferase enzyme family protein [Actinoalloteichus hoggarensis]MBB5919402.1 aminoglycoside phosphotransferase (APT) family kinase protein [Actinoalloteichus hoggarensis]
MQAAQAGRLTDEELSVLLGDAGLETTVRERRRLTGGLYNSVHRLRLADESRVVVKVSPDPTLPAMRYEKHILRTEALYFRLTGARNAPVPVVLHTAFDHPRIGADVLLTTELPGSPWSERTAMLSESTRSRTRRRLAEVVAGLHRVTGDRFGYPARSLGPTATTWRAAFHTMIEAVLADAERFDAPLPLPVSEIRAVVRGVLGDDPDSPQAATDGLLDAVTTPVLVHFDLWAGNILLDGPDAAPVIGGVIDGERAFWGDPAADLVSLALFEDIEQDEEFLTAYRDAGGLVVFDEDTRLRQALYRGYLYLIMLVETVPRGTSGEALVRLRRRLGGLLMSDLASLRRA